MLSHKDRALVYGWLGRAELGWDGTPCLESEATEITHLIERGMEQSCLGHVPIP